MTPTARAAASARLLFPFDEAWILLPDGDSECIVAFAGDGTDEQPPLRFPASDIPSLLRPDSATAADAADLPSSAAGRELARRAVRSFLAVPLRGADGEVRGHLGFGARRPGAFGDSEANPAAVVAELLAATLEESLALEFEREARRQIETVSRLLPAVASTLDIREVFHQVSETVKAAIPHDALAIQLLQAGSETVHSHVVTDRDPNELTDFELSRELNEHDLRDAITEDVSYQGEGDSLRAVLEGVYFTGETGVQGAPVRAVLDAQRTAIVRERGFRSFLRVVLHRGDQTIGALVFGSVRARNFHRGQLEVGRRIGEYVSLALSHRHLAAEAERTAEMRARAAMLEERVQELVQQAEEREGFHKCVGESPSWKEVLKQATRVATTDTTVLLTGESGTGKEVVARFIHRGSPRASGPLVAVNCAALPEQLLESELFGYERGAFSGALSTKPGRIEQAAKGVLFLDEIGEMSMALQAKLLRVLQEREFQRLGGTRTLKADVRVIAATNRDLQAAMRRNEFREDLFYRLRVFEIRLPPLRQRRDDILPLTEAFLAQLESTIGRRTAGLSREAREILLAYDWPGNIRELRNALERAVILCDGGLITGEQLHLATGAASSDAQGETLLPAGMNVEAHEKQLIEEALKRAHNNKSKAARLLGLSRAQLYFRLEKYGLAEPNP